MCLPSDPTEPRLHEMGHFIIPISLDVSMLQFFLQSNAMEARLRTLHKNQWVSSSPSCVYLYRWLGWIMEYLSKNTLRTQAEESKPWSIIVTYHLCALASFTQDGGGGEGYSKTVCPKIIFKEPYQGTRHHIKPDDFMLSKTAARAFSPHGRSQCLCFQFLLCQTGWWYLYPLGLEELSLGWTKENIMLRIRLAREIMPQWQHWIEKPHKHLLTWAHCEV